MQLYFLRHGIAEDQRPGLSDDERELTPEGVEKMRAEADALKRLKLRVDLIVTSPLPRARQTADIVAEALGRSDAMVEDARLAGGPSIGDLQGIVSGHPDAARLMLVGHNPCLPIVAGTLTGGSDIEMKKGGLVRVDTERIEPGAGVLVWLLPPSILTGR